VQPDLFVPVIEPIGPVSSGLGYALGPGRRMRQAQHAALSHLGPRWWESEEFAALERAVEEVFADTHSTGELVRPYVEHPYVEHLDAADRVAVWAGVAVPPPTPVLGVGRVGVTGPAGLDDGSGRGIATALPTRRELRRQREAQSSARAVAARRLAKGGVLALTMFGVVASNAPTALHDRLFDDSVLTAALSGAGVSAGSSGVAANQLAVRNPRDGVEDTLRTQLLKQRQTQQVSDAAQSAGGVLVAVAKAQAASDVAARKAALERATREARRNPRALARIMVARRGWSQAQYECLDLLWMRESGWNYQARNPSSGAFGLAQALPGSKMASAGPDWLTNPATQIEWGLGYIADRYGTPCAAWEHSEARNWY
jgi:hypothetical protein